ncbi:hypothetical protein A2115_00900 [Candidatus Woesebacteria bacterium GWA1_41_8]|uniref:7 transmembrane helices usually fused to an inactive transglutaminase domain-containing protein n=1 Tax=Candidatus Woesebacteria bacterium GWA1_41_8 TaxID=1802471 RepID=A0A1F7WI65_9BACT|nr:MAG: hypothetical protein A2115_00900 [Candidatus Woesebacteria bacterium GWA1_41_8]
MRNILALLIFVGMFLAASFSAPSVLAQRRLTPTSTPTPTATLTPSPTLLVPKPDITQKTEETLGHLEALLRKQELGPVWPTNPVKYAIREAISAGVPANTIVLLLLLPAVAAIIAAARHLIGIRGFGIFLPAALSVVFVATGPVVGIGLFLIIVIVSTLTRLILRSLKIKLQYLPRMALILWVVSFSVLGVLFMAPIIKRPELINVSIFAVLVLALLAEDFIRVQLGKSFKTALNLTTETVILALVSFIFLTLKAIQEFALLNPEVFLGSVFVFDFVIGRYVGLRLMEIWRFRKLIVA